jgi:MoaA/NifB/PqqE/SkfB family radical SAM enzyme
VVSLIIAPFTALLGNAAAWAASIGALLLTNETETIAHMPALGAKSTLFGGRSGWATGAIDDGASDMTSSAPVDPRRYHESVHDARTAVASRPPVCLYLEVTNRCNLLCTTCPRTYEELEPPADLSWDLFTRIVDQVPDLARAVLHGVGEPMLVKDLPRMVKYLKERNVYVLFNTNGTVLNARNGRALIEAGLDELRISLDASNRDSFKVVRGADYFNRIIRNVRAFRDLQEREGIERPRVSLWLTGLKETIKELPAFVKVAADVGVREVYLQRLVFFDQETIGLARPDQALFESTTNDEAACLQEAINLAHSLGIVFNASGAASEPGLSLKKSDGSSPWSLCRRPWSLMYFTANGRALPCCIAPFSSHGYANYTLGDATKQSLQEIWNGPAYNAFRAALMSDRPPAACTNCGLRWSL